MNKFLLTSCAFLFAVATVNAKGYVSSFSQAKEMEVAKVTEKPAAEKNYVKWGYADPTTPLSQWNDKPSLSSDKEINAAYFVEGSGALKGTRIVAIDVPSAYDNTRNVTVWIRSELTGENLVSQTFDGPIASGTFHRFVLNEPFSIPESGVYVGYTSTTRKIANAGSDKKPNSIWLQMGTGKWKDYYDTNGFGALLMQVEVDGALNLPENAATISSFGARQTFLGEKATITANIENTGRNQVSSVDYTVDVDGVKTTRHSDFSTPVNIGFNGTNAEAINFEITSPDVAKNYDIRVNVDKVNGVDNADKDKVTTVTFKNVLRKVARRSVVEEFTGTGCGYCPRGWAGMETMKERYPDSFIGIALHQYNNNDAMFVGYDYPISAQGAPSCSMNRGPQIDPYSGSNDSPDIIYDLEAANSVPPLVDVTVSGKYNEDRTSVTAKGTVEYLSEPETKYSVAYVLTADGLTGTTNAWKQHNYYYSSTAGSAHVVDNIPLLKEFCAGGKYGQEYVSLVYNDVEISSSYKSRKNVAPAVSGEAVPGGKATSEYVLDLPAGNAELMGALKYDKVYVVALVFDDNTGEIVNAARSQVTDNETGVRTIGTDGVQAKELSRFTADGTKVSAPVSGLNIIKMSDGTIRKVIERR